MKRALFCLLLAGMFSGCGSDPANRPAEEIVYTGCNNNNDCEGGRCIAGFPNGGLCTHNCGTGDECPEGTVCADTEASRGVCLFRCTSTAECRELVDNGYVCDTESNIDTSEDVRVCID